MKSEKSTIAVPDGRPSNTDPVIIKSWTEFRKTGLFLFLNQFLHVFGWALVLTVDSDTGQVTDVRPARVVFRGFDNKEAGEDYIKISEYLVNNAPDLLNEAKS